MPYELHGQGSDLAIRVSGPDRTSCLVAAVRGFAAALVGDQLPPATRTLDVDLDGGDDRELLLALMDEAIWHLDTSGALAVDFSDVAVAGDRLSGTLHAVDLDHVDVIGIPPKAATWHALALGPAGDAWRGTVILDL